MIKKKRLRRKKQNKFLTYFLLVLFALFALLPFYYLVITAFKDLEEAATQATMWPRSFALFENIKFVLTHPDYNVLGMFVRTMFVFVMKTTGTLVTCTLAAYAFARYKFPGKNIIFFVLLSTMMIPGELLGIPIYEFFVNTGLKEVAYIPLWLSTWFATDVFIIFMLKQFFSKTPQPLIDAARIDGAGETQILTKIIVPLNKPIFTTVILLYFIGTYNDLYGPALYITRQSDWLMTHSINIFENLFKSGSSSYIVPWNYVAVACLIAMIPEII
jgi:ABC-type glycerol-3-phosphate transport system permease component